MAIKTLDTEESMLKNLIMNIHLSYQIQSKQLKPSSHNTLPCILF